MRDEWLRLKGEFKAIAERNTANPHFVSFSGMVWTRIGPVAAGCRNDAKTILNLCRAAGRLLGPKDRHAEFRGCPIPPSKQEPEVVAWILFVANSPESEVDWLPPGVGHGFHGRLRNLAYASHWAIYHVLANLQTEAAPKVGPPAGTPAQTEQLSTVAGEEKRGRKPKNPQLDEAFKVVWFSRHSYKDVDALRKDLANHPALLDALNKSNADHQVQLVRTLKRVTQQASRARKSAPRQ